MTGQRIATTAAFDGLSLLWFNCSVCTYCTLKFQGVIQFTFNHIDFNSEFHVYSQESYLNHKHWIRNWKKCDFTLFVWPLGVAIAYVHRARLRTAMLRLRSMSGFICLFWLIAFVLINCLLFDLLYCVCTMYSIYKQVDVSKEQHREEKRDSISNKNTNNLSKQTLLVQANNFEIVVIFFHISHNLTWYSAIVHKFTKIHPVCSTYQLTKQLK